MQKEEYLKYMIIFVFTTSNDSFSGFFLLRINVEFIWGVNF